MRARSWGKEEGRLEAGSRSAASAVTLQGPETAVQQARRGGQAARKATEERRGRSRRQKIRDDGGDRGAASVLYPGQAA
jgi:hypothetical protein